MRTVEQIKQEMQKVRSRPVRSEREQQEKEYELRTLQIELEQALTK